MNKTVYNFLKRVLDKQEKEKIICILEKKLNDDELEKLNKKYNDKNTNLYYNESDIKFIILEKNKYLFNLNEFNYYLNLLSLKKLTKK